MSYLGIDLGTSGLRALLQDEEGQTIASAQMQYDVSHPQDGWSEQDPQHWINALEATIAEVSENHAAFKTIKGIGVAGHMHGATLIDQNNEPLRPCILWNDTRSMKEAARLDGLASMRELSGNIVFPGFTAPKLEWVKANEPETFAKVHKVLLPAAFLNLYLTGDCVADMSDSAGTSWLDIRERQWSKELLSLSGMQFEQMPRLVEGSEKAGTLRPELKSKWGLIEDVIVAGGAGDNAAAACGIGALKENEGFVSLGTSGVLLVARDACSPAPETAVHTFCHAVPERWYQMGVMLSATDCLNWFSKNVGRKPADLTADLGNDLKPPSSVQFWPYLSGERTPHNDSEIRASFIGLTLTTSHQEMTSAVLEGVAFGLRDNLEALCATGADPKSLFAIGGGSASHYWLKLIATVLNIPLKLPAGGEFGAALGAARLGQLAASNADPETVLTKPEVSTVIEPDEALVAAYNAAYQHYKTAYPMLKQLQR